MRLGNTVITVFLLTGLLLVHSAAVGAAEISPFRSDGCSLFPDGTLNNRTQWCDCCLQHDLAYWQGGTEEERRVADTALRDCVLERTGDATLAKVMYLGVRAGGHPAFPAWYRWGYGWDYGRGYRPLNAEEQAQVRQQRETYAEQHPQGYCKESEDTAVTERLPSWATPVPSEHLANFYRLDAKVYRSAQPDSEGFAELKTRGIGTILSLREYHADDPGDVSGLKLHRVRMAAGSVTTAQVVAALRIIRDSEGPILIHCWHGSDRTGLISAMYRIVFQGWDKEDAIAELTDGGYGYHAFWYGNIPEFIRTADIAAIRQAVTAQ